MLNKLLLLAGGLIATLACYSQDCLGSYFLQNNKTIEMAILYKKGAQTAKQVYTVTNVESSGNSTTANLAQEMFDKKGKTIVKCTAKI